MSFDKLKMLSQNINIFITFCYTIWSQNISLNMRYIYKYYHQLEKNISYLHHYIYIYLCLSFSSPISSEIVFPSKTDLSKAPDIIVISHTPLFPKNTCISLSCNILFSSFDISSTFCTFLHPLF